MDIPKNYWNGDKTVEFRTPWLTPESIGDIEHFIKPEHKVLEFGAGGSTLFFADRCSYVLSFETLNPWYYRMKEIIPANVDLHFVSNFEEIVMLTCQHIFTKPLFDICLVDICNISRPDLTKFGMTKVKKGGIVIIDNYDADYCKGIDGTLLHKDFDDIHWAGKGTRIYYL